MGYTVLRNRKSNDLPTHHRLSSPAERPPHYADAKGGSEGKGTQVVKPVNSSKEYARALKLAQKQSVPSKTVYDLLLKADKLGDARATYAIATWYLHGSPFTKISYAKAVRLLRHAAQGGVADAAFDLAISYEKGAGITKSVSRAFEYYVRAALLGDAKAHFEVSRMYFHGIGVKRNRALAEIWRDKAARLGVSEAK